MVPRDLPSMLVHILKLTNPNSASNFGLQSDPRRFFLMFYHLTLNLTLRSNSKVLDGAARLVQHAVSYFGPEESQFGQ